MKCSKCGSENIEITGGTSSVDFDEKGYMINVMKINGYCKDCGEFYEEIY